MQAPSRHHQPCQPQLSPPQIALAQAHSPQRIGCPGLPGSGAVVPPCTLLSRLPYPWLLPHPRSKRLPLPAQTARLGAGEKGVGQFPYALEHTQQWYTLVM
eukprot:1159512-Pelagomonas_calceolata.AAC.3